MQRLRFALRVEFFRHGAHHPWVETNFPENCPDFLNPERRLIEIQVNDVVVAIDLIAKPRNGLELMIKF